MMQTGPRPFVLNLDEQRIQEEKKKELSKENKRYASNQVKFPITRAVLWNREPLSAPVIVRFFGNKPLRVTLSDRALHLAFHHGKQLAIETCMSFVIGYLDAESSEHVILQLDRFDPGREAVHTMSGILIKRHLPTTMVPGDVAVPLKIINGLRRGEDGPPMTKEEIAQGVKYLAGRMKSEEPINLSHFLVSRACCYFHSDLDEIVTHFACNIMVPVTHFSVTRIKPVPIIPTALARNLCGPMRLSTVQGQAKFGYLTMDHTRKLLLLLETDPKVKSLPLVGVTFFTQSRGVPNEGASTVLVCDYSETGTLTCNGWISGIANVYSAFTWACLVKFTNSDVIEERVFAPPRDFLLAFYAPTSPQPEFYECSEKSNEGRQSYELFQCKEEILLKQLADFQSQGEYEFFMEKEMEGEESTLPDHKSNGANPNLGHENNDILSESDPRDPPSPQCTSFSRHSEALPSPHPSPKPHPQLNQFASPSVPEVSFLEPEATMKVYNPSAYQQVLPPGDKDDPSFDKKLPSGDKEARPNDKEAPLCDKDAEASGMVHSAGGKRIPEDSAFPVSADVRTQGEEQIVDADSKPLSMIPLQDSEQVIATENRLSPYNLIAEQQRQLAELREQVLQLLQEKKQESQVKAAEKYESHSQQGCRGGGLSPSGRESTETNAQTSLVLAPDISARADKRISLGTNTGQSLLIGSQTSVAIENEMHDVTVTDKECNPTLVPCNAFGAGQGEDSSACLCHCRQSQPGGHEVDDGRKDNAKEAGKPSSSREISMEASAMSLAFESPFSERSQSMSCLQAAPANQSLNETMKSELVVVDVPEYDGSTISPVKNTSEAANSNRDGNLNDSSFEESASHCQGSFAMDEGAASPKTFVSENFSEYFYKKMMEQVKELLEYQVTEKVEETGTKLDSSSSGGSSSSSVGTSDASAEDRIVKATFKELDRITGRCLMDKTNSLPASPIDTEVIVHPKIEYRSLFVDQSLDASQYSEVNTANQIALKYLSAKEARELQRDNKREITKTVKFHGVVEKAVKSQWKTSFVSMNLSCNLSIATKQYLKRYDLLDKDKENAQEEGLRKTKPSRREPSDRPPRVLDLRKLKSLPKLP